MAASQKQNNLEPVNFFRVQNGKFILNVNADHPNAKEEVRNGKTYYYIEFDVIESNLKEIIRTVCENKDRTKTWAEIAFVMRDDNHQKEVLTVYEGNESEQLLNRLINCDFTKTVTFEVFRDKEKNKNVLMVKQGGNLIKNLYNKDNKKNKIYGNIPDLEEITFKGKKSLDDTKRRDFWAKVIEKMNDYLKGNGQNFAS